MPASLLVLKENKMKRDIVLIPGVGIGPEIVEHAVRCIDVAIYDEKYCINWIRDYNGEEILVGESAIKKYKTPLPQHVIDAVKKYGLALKGPVTTPIGFGFRSVNVALRQALNLYACVRPCKIYEGVKTNFKNVDLVVIRENSEDLYAGIEYEKGTKSLKDLIKFIETTKKKKIDINSGISIKPISEKATERIVRYAFEYAIANNRKKVTAVTKANIMKFTDGLFKDIAEKVSKYYPSIQYEHNLIDNQCMQLVQKPELYDILVTENLYGDIVSDLCAGLVGGLGVAPGTNIGDDCAIFEAVHGSAPKYKGMNKVNPIALIMSGMLMLKYINYEKAANRLENAVATVIKEGKYVTYDLKPSRDDSAAVGTKEMADAIIDKLK